MDIKRFVVELDTKAVGEAGEFEGYASTFNGVDLGNDSIAEGAFTKTLDQWGSKGQLPAMLWMHDMGNPIGEWQVMREDSKGLFVKGKLWIDDVPAAKQAHKLLTSNGPKGMSIGYSVKDASEEVIDGERVRLLKDVDLFEVSVVPFGMNQDALVTNAKALANEGEIDFRQLEKSLMAGGLSKAKAQAFIAKGKEGLVERDASEGERDAVSPDLIKGFENILTQLKGNNHE